MLVVVTMMLLILAVSGLVLAVVAYPLRGRTLSRWPWLDRLLRRAARAFPGTEDRALDPVPGPAFDPVSGLLDVRPERLHGTHAAPRH